MGYSSSNLSFMILISLSYAAISSSSSSSSIRLPQKPYLSSSLQSSSTKSSSSPSSRKALAEDLISLLGTKNQASTINTNEAQKLRSCFKFLVPFSPPIKPTKSHDRRRDLLVDVDDDEHLRSSVLDFSGRCRSTENELIWWPPAPVLELARLGVDSGGDPGAIHRALDPTILPVPDIEGSKEHRCELTRSPYGRQFINKELNDYLAFLFELIVARGPSVGLNVSLSRYDFFHGHLFLANNSSRLGILFHAKEYPAYEEKLFPYNTGYCQRGSNVAFDDSMNLRNILWLAPLPSNSTKDWLAPGVLVVLDAHPGGIIYEDLIPDYVQMARTIYEEYLGDIVVDVNYLNIGEAEGPDFRIFIC